MIKSSKIYLHTPALDGEDSRGLGILELVAADSSRAMLGVFRLADGGDDGLTVRFKGIDASKRYLVRTANAGEQFELDGRVLKYEGLRLAPGTSLTSELILLTALS